MSAFYNEFEPFAAAWLRELIKAGVIEDGEVCSTGIVGDAENNGQERPLHDSQRSLPTKGAGATNGYWRNAEWLPCRDGKARPTKPGLFPLAHGVQNRVGTLRGAGNAIVPQVGAAFVRAYLEAGRA